MIVPPDSPDLIFCLCAEYDAFISVYPDEKYLVHCTYTNVFLDLDDEQAVVLRAR